MLLLGLDGLSFDFLEAPHVRQHLPNLISLFKRPQAGPLLSTLPPYTGPAWTTITTGVNPGRHGVFGFTGPSGRVVSGNGVGVPRVWDYVGEAGGKSVVMNVPITFPPQPIEGIMVSGMPTPPGAPFSSPPAAGDLEDLGYVVDIGVQKGGRESEATLGRLTAMTTARGRAAARLARKKNWDLFAIVFVLPDRLGHPWWKFLVPGHRLYETRAGERVRRRAAGALSALDAAVGELISACPAGTAVVACSDHGFGPLRADIFFDLALADAGLVTAGRPGLLTKAVSTAGRWPLARMLPPSVNRRVRRMTGEGSRAEDFAWTAPGFESGVRLKDPADDAVRDRVTGMLKDLRDPSGKAVVDEVLPREDIYEGPFVSDAAHLVVKMADETVSLHEGLHAARPWVSREREAWGTHAAQGVVALSCRNAPVDPSGQAADIAPTVLDLLGLYVDGLDGRSLIDGADMHHRTVSSVRGAPAEEQPENVYSPEDEAAVIDHLRELGYVD